MKCTETSCSLNCYGNCQNVSAIKDYFLLQIPEPDGCPEMHPKTDMSEE